MKLLFVDRLGLCFGQNAVPELTELVVNRSQPLVSGEELLCAPPDRGGIVALCVQWDWTCSCMLLIDCPLKHSFLLLPWCDDHEILCFVVAVQNIPLQYIKISPLSTLRSPTPPAAPDSLTTTPRNTHTFHKTCHTSAAQSGVMLDSVNSPDGELNKSYNATLNDGETEGQQK